MSRYNRKKPPFNKHIFVDICNELKEITKQNKTSEDKIGDVCNEIKEIKKLNKASENRIIDVYSITIPEAGGVRTFTTGTTEIDLKIGVITNPGNTIENLKRSLDAYQPKDLMHSVSITSNKDIKFKLDNGSYYTIKSNVSSQLSNVTYRNITIICTEETEISLFCSTNPDTVLDEKRAPVGSEGEPFNQCSHNTMMVLDKYQYEVEHGEKDTRVGRSLDIDIGSFIVLANAAFTQPTDGIQMELVSNDVGDDSVGAGAQLVRITYFTKTTWLRKTTDVIMDGTTIVNTTATDIYRIDKAEVIKGRPAIGTITIKDTTGATLYGQIEPLTTYMERAMAYVETGKRCVVTDILISTQSKEGIIFRAFKSDKVGDNIVTRGRYSATMVEDALPLEFNLPFSVENPYGDRIALGLAVSGIADNQGASGSFRYYCEDI